jgi:hypothetical protein
VANGVKEVTCIRHSDNVEFPADKDQTLNHLP